MTIPAGEHPFRLDGKVAIVTGAGRGIGRAIAHVFASAGAQVVIATRGEEAGREVLDSIVAHGGRARLMGTDIGSRAACREVVERTVEQLGRLDILVHNAGIFPQIGIEVITDEELERVLAVNLKSAFWLAEGAAPLLRAAPAPRLLFTSSVTGPRVALPNLAHYAASKAGLNGFIRAAAMEFARDRITVNGVEPGLIATDALRELGDDEAVTQMTAAIPLRRLGTPEEIAYAMLFLASEQAGFITGQTIVVDGGALIPENSALMP
jgi:3-oxoacyl-[acyl-carrier protein] reductase